MLDPYTPLASALAQLRALIPHRVFLPGDAGYDAARTPWNVAVDQRPAAVAVPTSVEEVIAVVRAARADGLGVAPQSTGHAAATLADRLADTVLVRLSDFTGVTIDPERRVARVIGGTVWEPVVQAAAAHGLAALHGSSPDVGVIGYTLGGGLSWYARTHGLAAHYMVGADIVTASGDLIRVDATHHPDLFWALRGGGGNFGVVVALEFELLPLAEVYGGMLLWDGARAAEVAHAWALWSRSAPDTATTSLRLLSLPPLPELPDFLRGRQLVVVDGAVLGDEAEAAEVLAPLRTLRPEIDTFARVPAAAMTRVHLDPEGPTPGISDHTLLDAFPAAAVDAYLAASGPDSGSTLLSAEIRHLGGALGRPHSEGGALASVDGDYSAFFVGIAPTPQIAAQAVADAARAVDALRPWSRGRAFLNLTETVIGADAGFTTEAWERLREVRASVDPEGAFVAAHAI